MRTPSPSFGQIGTRALQHRYEWLRKAEDNVTRKGPLIDKRVVVSTAGGRLPKVGGLRQHYTNTRRDA